MANTVAYPDLALKKFSEIVSSEDPRALICLLEKNINFSPGSRAAKNEKLYKPYVTIQGKPFSNPFYGIRLLSGSIHYKLHCCRTKIKHS